MKFYNFDNKNKEKGIINLYGQIISEKPWWSEGQFIVPDDFLQNLEELKDCNEIEVHINSGGGDVFVATAIYTQLKNLNKNIEIIIDGICASAATIIAMAGDIIKIPSNALFMIHNPSVFLFDNYSNDELSKVQNSLITCKNAIMEAYKTKLNLSNDDLSELMDNETWLTGVEAVEKGFCDEILYENAKIENKGLYTMFNNVAIDNNLINTDIVESNVNERLKRNIENMELVNKEIKKSEIGGKKMDLEKFKNDYPDIYNSIVDSSKKEERTRIKEIDDISTTLSADLVDKAKYTDITNAKDLAFNALKNEKLKAKEVLDNMEEDSKNSNVDNVTNNVDKDEISNKSVDRVSALKNASKIS